MVPLRPASCRSLLLSLAFAGGCAEVLGVQPGGITLETSASDYVAIPDGAPGIPQRYFVEMVVAITNESGRPITLQGCAESDNTPRFAVSMAAVRNDWQSAYENAWSCLTPTYLTLAVGESRVDRIELSGPRSFDAFTGDPVGILEGRMRLVYYVDGLTVWSNAFDVALPDAP